MKVREALAPSRARSVLAVIAAAGAIVLSWTTSGIAQQHYVVGADRTTTFGSPAPVLAVGDSVTVLKGVRITVTGAGGILFQNVGSNEIINLGTVMALGDESHAIQLSGSPNSSITNAGIVISAAPALYVFESENSTVTNLGQVTTTLGGVGLYLHSSANSTLINHGSITTSESDAAGLYAFDSPDARLQNTGTIVTNANDTYGMSVAQSARAQLINSGTIQTGGVRWSDGMVARDSSNASLTNNGTITVPGSEASGVVVYNSAGSHLVNNGTINMVGVGGAPPSDLGGLFVHDNSHNSIAENNGTINVNGIADGILINSLGVVAHNRGVIAATGSDATGYRTEVASTLINSGTIFAGSPTARAIVFAGAGAADRLTLLAGTRLQGTIDLGGGADTVTLDRTGDSVGWRFTLENFDETAGGLVVKGGRYTIERSGTRTTVTIADVTPHEGAASKLAVLASGLGQGVLDQLTLRGTDTGPAVWAAAFGAGLDGSRFGGAGFGADASTLDGAVRLGAFVGAGQSATRGAGSGYETNEVYGGLYGRIVGEDGYFADVVMLGGRGQGTSTTRQIANNLVPGGLETVSGGGNSGTYVAIKARAGVALPVAFGMLVPSLTVGYAQEKRRGYVEAGAGGLAVSDHKAKALDARAAVTALISPKAIDGRLHLGASGGLDLAIDLSDPVAFDMAGTNFALPGNRGTSRGTWFLGVTGSLESQALRFKASAELLANAWNSGAGARVSLRLVGMF